MKEFIYEIRDEVGIHARPAGLLINEIKKYNSKVSITKGEKTVDATRLFSVMGLGVKCGETVKVTIEGEDEEETLKTLEDFFKKNF